jgi:hypothetical protein
MTNKFSHHGYISAAKDKRFTGRQMALFFTLADWN